jgi:hypothetical protein
MLLGIQFPGHLHFAVIESFEQFCKDFAFHFDFQCLKECNEANRWVISWER